MRGNKGFALVDVLTGILILGIGISSLVSLSTATRNYTYLSQWQAKAVNVAQSHLEEIRSMNWADIENQFPLGYSVSTPTPDGITVVTQVKEYGTDIVEIEVSGGWALQGKNRTVTLTSLLSRR